MKPGHGSNWNSDERSKGYHGWPMVGALQGAQPIGCLQPELPVAARERVRHGQPSRRAAVLVAAYRSSRSSLDLSYGSPHGHVTVAPR